MKKRTALKLKYPILIIVSFILSFFILDLLFPFQFHIRYSAITETRDGELMYAFLSNDEKWRMKSNEVDITPELKKIFLFKEDKYFPYHLGVNPFAIFRAAINNLIHQKRTSGASTITMQVVRLLHPAKRTLWNKLKEMFNAIQLELHYSKKEILSMYFDLIPCGGNIEGVKAASWLYFGKVTSQLSIAQSAALVIIPNRPNTLNPAKNLSLLKKERNKWLARMGEEKLFTKKMISDAINEPLEMQRKSIPVIAPHLSTRLHLNDPYNPVIKTTIKKNIQVKVEQLLSNYHQRLQMHDVHNLSAMVVNNATHEINAYVGNADFYDTENNGEVDGLNSIRSPGSTLKPLLYAVAMDKGLITPKTILYDVPVNYSGYSPENFNKQCNGKVTAEKALAYSLNIPAVSLLEQIKVNSLSDKLQEAGFSSILSQKKNLGLSTILGGCGVKPLELAGLYCAFANNGIYKPIHCTTSENADSHRLISDASAFMITEILTQLQRPDLPNNSESSIHIPKVAWKTGTSYGRRDAWSVGYNKKFTVLVWAGNFDNTGVPELSGAEMATPLLFEIFNLIDYNSSANWFTPPASVDLRYVCPESGKIPSTFCTEQVMDYFIPSVSDQQLCEHLQQIPVSADEKYSYCSECIPQSGYKKLFYPNLSPQLISYYKSEHIPFQVLPAHNPLCSRIFNGEQPKILSPANGQEYLIEKNNSEKIQLACASANDVKTIYWYINDAYYGKCKADEKIFFIPVPGEIKISCADDKGRNVDIKIKVSFL